MFQLFVATQSFRKISIQFPKNLSGRFPFRSRHNQPRLKSLFLLYFLFENCPRFKGSRSKTMRKPDLKINTYTPSSRNSKVSFTSQALRLLNLAHDIFNKKPLD